MSGSAMCPTRSVIRHASPMRSDEITVRQLGATDSGGAYGQRLVRQSGIRAPGYIWSVGVANKANPHSQNW